MGRDGENGGSTVIATPLPDNVRRRDALGGVTVVEFGGYAAGPAIGRGPVAQGLRTPPVSSISWPGAVVARFLPEFAQE